METEAKRSDYCVVLTTFNDDKNQNEVITALLKKRLAACIQVLPIQSFYRWNGKINCDNEKILLIKTKSSLYQRVEAEIVSKHSYDTPEIIRVGIDAGLDAYLNWIEDECQ